MTVLPRAPSGGQFHIASGDQSAVVVEVGGGIRSYSAAGRELIDGYGADEMSGAGRGQVLMPWPNRIEDGSYEFNGRRLQLPINDVEERDAIHGLVRWASWRPRERAPERVVLEHSLHPQPGYPFSLAVEIEYALSGEGLRVTTSATNVGAAPCPYGCGFHPYLSVGTPTVDIVTLGVPARTVVFSDERGIPVRSQPVDGGEYDFRRPRPLGPIRLDNAFTDLDRDENGIARVTLSASDGSGVTLWVDGAYRHLMLFTGDPVPEIRRRSLAVEPMTCPPNAFRTGEDLIELVPGESFTGTWGLEPQREGGSGER
jgi:aldose 1-epimerase